MDTVDSIQKLCQRLICFALHRCRVSVDLCRISVVLSVSQVDNPAVVRISNGTLAVRSTGISDEEVHNHELSLKEVTSTGKLRSLPSIPKNGVKFSGTEVCLSVCEKLDVLLDDINRFFQKMVIQNLPEHNWVISTSTVESLKSGFENYVLKSTYGIAGNSDSRTIAMENLKTGVRTTCRAESCKHAGLVMDAVVIICKISDRTDPSPMECSSQTEVCSVFQGFLSVSSLQIISKRIVENQLEKLRLDFSEHCRRMRRCFPEMGKLATIYADCCCVSLLSGEVSYPLARQKAVSNKSLLKKAAKLAFYDLKEKHKGILLGDHALKIRSYAPDLARTLAGLIQTSNDSDFREEFLSLLGFESGQAGAEADAVEECIREKIISVIELNDKKPENCKEAAPFLFEVDRSQELNFAKECEEGDYAFDFFDL